MVTASAAGIALLILLSNKTARAMIMPEAASTPVILPASTSMLISTVNATISVETATFTPTPTLIYLTTSTTSATPLPTAILTLGEQKVKTGELYFAGPLTQAEQIRLYNTSITFMAPTTKESKQIGEQIAGVGYGSPTLICGPLSITILQTSGLLASDIVPFDFWLLNPFLAKDREILARAFPPAQYDHYETTTSLKKIDFAASPLLPGDFIYIKHGSGGTFDHMLVVNRVDQMGRAYSVTNYNSAQGFIISEVLLYDPLDLNAGMFKQWTKQRNALDGATGFGGFELWRLRTQ